MFHFVLVCCYLTQSKAGATVQSESPDCDMSDTAAASTAITANDKADCDRPDELDVNNPAKANSSTADTDAEEKAAAGKPAVTLQALSITVITADKADGGTPGELDVNTLAEASCDPLVCHPRSLRA